MVVVQLDYRLWIFFFFRTPRAERRHYISKGCDTREACTRRK